MKVKIIIETPLPYPIVNITQPQIRNSPYPNSELALTLNSSLPLKPSFETDPYPNFELPHGP